MKDWNGYRAVLLITLANTRNNNPMLCVVDYTGRRSCQDWPSDTKTHE